MSLDLCRTAEGFLLLGANALWLRTTVCSPHKAMPLSIFLSDQHDDRDVITRTRARPKVERPKLYKVLLLNDDYTPREFVVQILKAEFRLTDDEAYHVMIMAHQKGLCVVAVYTKDVAETKAARATDMAKEFGYPLMFETEPEE